MSSLRVRAVERAGARSRCAFCHGDLDGEIARCERCHSELHADCRATLGRCPTLGCTARGERPLPLPTATAAPPAERPAAGWVLPRWLALAELYLVSGGGALLFGACTLGLLGGMAGLAVTLVWMIRDGLAHASTTGTDWVFAALVMFFVAGLLGWVALGTFRIARDFVRGAWRARTLVGGEPMERMLVSTWESGSGRGGHVAFALESRTNRDRIPGWIPLKQTFMISPGWSGLGSTPVQAYGLEQDGPILLRTERGRLSVAVRDEPRRPGRRRP